MINILKSIILATIFFMASSLNVFGAGSDSSSSSSSYGSSSSYSSNSSNEDIMLITASLNKKDYKNSYKLAKNATVNQPNNADAWNYLGFSSRKLGKYDESEVAYKKALSIDPQHVGALEYYGELHLTLKQPEKAKLLLAELKNLCTMNCKEMKQLEKAIQNYESN
tara:strand:- start:230 stop:727 length:498 start_codon:yes stop_codon:yes gene_type:complete